jgi:hypothetical protein
MFEGYVEVSGAMFGALPRGDFGECRALQIMTQGV